MSRSRVDSGADTSLVHRIGRSLAVLLISALTGVASYTLVAQRVAGGTADAEVVNPGPSAAADPGASPAPSPPSVADVSDRPRGTAGGQQLWAPAPLDRVNQDQGSSITLPDGRILWIFADTFQAQGSPRFFITSAAALTDPGRWRLQYAMSSQAATRDATGSLGEAREPHPSEFLPRTAAERADRQPGTHYLAVWPTGSTLLPNGQIVISYAKYRVFPREKQYTFLSAGLFAYRYTDPVRFVAGAQATRIADDIWTSADGEVRSPVYVSGRVYFSQCQQLRCHALRAPAATLADRTTYEWWTGSGWSTSRARRSTVRVGSSHPGGNPSVVLLRPGVFAMADTEAGSPAATGLLWVAPHPWGPWSKAAGFTLPHCGTAGCYGLNLHPQASTTTSLRVSYADGDRHPVVRVADVPVTIAPGASAVQVG